MNRKIYFLLSVPLFFAVFIGAAFAYKFDFITVSDVVDKIQEKFGSLDTYQASFSIVSEKLEKRKSQHGVISYKNSNRLLVDYSSPQGQKIVSNGKTMWIYIPSMNVVAEQDLKNDEGFFSTHSKSGLKRLFSKYHYRFNGKEQPEKQADGSKQYTLLLQQKESRSGYRTLKLWVSEDYMIVRAQGETASGKKVDISFSQIKTNIDLPNGMFKFDVPGKARVIKNPMIAEE
jgi:outer membrane lipoprotein-sorting protein